MSGKGEAWDFKLIGVRIDRQAYNPKKAKVGQNWRDLRQVTYFYNFCTPATSIVRLNLHTSNLVHRLTTGGTIQ